jgi:hypothetical protein
MENISGNRFSMLDSGEARKEYMDRTSINEHMPSTTTVYFFQKEYQ